MTSMVIGSVGVGLLLLAFGLNLIKKLSEASPIYLIINALGAGMAAWYAYDGRIIPFVILELTWALTAIIRLALLVRRSSP